MKNELRKRTVALMFGLLFALAFTRFAMIGSSYRKDAENFLAIKKIILNSQDEVSENENGFTYQISKQDYFDLRDLAGGQMEFKENCINVKLLSGELFGWLSILWVAGYFGFKSESSNV